MPHASYFYKRQINANTAIAAQINDIKGPNNKMNINFINLVVIKTKKKRKRKKRIYLN